MLECMGWDGSMVAHGGLPPVCNEILQDRAGEQTPSQTRVSLGQADPHENSGVWTQMQSTAVEIGVQTVGIETLVTDLEFFADLEFDLEWDTTEPKKADGVGKCRSRQYAREMVRQFAREMVSEGMELVEIEFEMGLVARDTIVDWMMGEEMQQQDTEWVEKMVA